MCYQAGSNTRVHPCWLQQRQEGSAPAAGAQRPTPQPDSGSPATEAQRTPETAVRALGTDADVVGGGQLADIAEALLHHKLRPQAQAESVTSPTCRLDLLIELSSSALGPPFCGNPLWR